MAARYGIGLEAESPVPEGSPIRLRRGQSAPVQHLSLLFSEKGLEVHDAQGRIRALYVDLVRGLTLGWQELRMTLREATKDDLVIEPEFVPGAASFGGGAYFQLRAGLRVEFRGGRSLTLTAWDPSNLEGKVKVEDGARSEEHLTTGESPALGLRWRLREGPCLILEDLR